MKRINFDKKEQRVLRHKRFVNKFKSNTITKPRLIVVKSNAHISAQLFDDRTNKVLCSSSSVQLKLKNGNVENATKVGDDIAKKITKLKITEIVFDRAGSKYHGRVKAVAEAVRAAGLKF